jgi:c-di-AMP phosphodiesterase-like protein
MNDFTQTIVKYLVILIVIIITFKILLPVIMGFLGWLLNVILKLAMYGAIIFVLYLMGRFIYESYKNNS